MRIWNLNWPKLYSKVKISASDKVLQISLDQLLLLLVQSEPDLDICILIGFQNLGTLLAGRNERTSPWTSSTLKGTNFLEYLFSCSCNCSSEGIIYIYAARCKKHDSIHVGHTGVALRIRFDRHTHTHRYDIRSRPGNSEQAEHFHGKNHRESDMEVSILQTGITNEKHREFLEDRWISRLQTWKYLNIVFNQYAKDMYELYSKIVGS